MTICHKEPGVVQNKSSLLLKNVFQNT